jgi:hypothetical protein
VFEGVLSSIILTVSKVKMVMLAVSVVRTADLAFLCASAEAASGQAQTSLCSSFLICESCNYFKASLLYTDGLSISLRLAHPLVYANKAGWQYARVVYSHQKVNLGEYTLASMG